jgi:8-oxo-dGTP pyrophosphatase MutT (NUDIX family)
MQDLIHKIQSGLQQPLPGIAAHNKMAHAARQTKFDVPTNARQASVLALLYPKLEEWHIVLIERTSRNPNDQHKGQISFPGGSHDASDPDFKFTALREAEEEVGVDPNDIQILGELTDLYIPVSNFNVNPFVGFMEYTPSFIPQESEVASILEVPFQRFISPNIRQKTNINITPQITLKEVPYFNIDNKVLWGATAMMMSELIDIVQLA